MGALAGAEAAKRANQAAATNKANAMAAYGMNAFERQERQKILTKQTFTASQTQGIQMMYSSAKAIGAVKARAAGAGRTTGDQGIEQSINAMRAVFDFEGRTAARNIRDGMIRIDSMMRSGAMQSQDQLSQSLAQARAMERSESTALLSGLFQDVGMVVGMGTGIAGAVGSFQ